MAKKIKTKYIPKILIPLFSVLMIFVLFITVKAADSFVVGTASLVLGSGDNLFYGNIDSASNAASNFLLFQKEGSTNLFKVGSDGGGYFMGSVGIGLTNPTSNLHLYGSGSAYQSAQTNLIIDSTNGYPGITLADSSNSNWLIRAADSSDNDLWIHRNSGTGASPSWASVMAFDRSSGSIGIGTTTFSSALVSFDYNGGAGATIDAGNSKIQNVATAVDDADALPKGQFLTLFNAYLQEISTSTNINLNGNNIIGVNKLTVNTIDPLYRIKGINYSTFAASIAGGVKEEYVGNFTIDSYRSKLGYERVIDFSKLEIGSDLWLWRQTVDFSENNVQVFMTPRGGFAQLYYLVEGDSLILRSDKKIDVSLRLIGKRIDWRKWPTRAIDQEERASFIID